MNYLRIGLLLCLYSSVSSQEYGNYATIERSLLLRDVALLHQGLDKYHTGMYWYTPKDSVELAFREATLQISKDLNALAFHKIIAPLVALSREDHTNIFLPESIEEKMKVEAKFLPITVVFLGRELYLLRNASGVDKNLEGRKILSINGTPVEEIVNNIGNLFASDGYIKTVKYNDLRGFEFAKHYYYFYGNVSEFKVAFEEETITLEPLSRSSIRQNLLERYGKASKQRAPGQSLEFQILNDSTAYLGLHTFSNSTIRENKVHQNLNSFLENSFKKIAQRRIQHLIIDVSKNGGGNEGNENLVFSYLGKNYQKYKKVKAKTQSAILDNGTDPPIKLKTFGFLERTFANRKMQDGSYERRDNLGFGLQAYKKQPRYPFNGKLYVLISPITYSGGSELANMIFTNQLATFIGQETGGGYLGNTSGYGQELTLPHSKITIDIPALQFVMNVDDRIPRGRGVIPDHLVIPTFQEYVDGRNAALEFALTLIEK